MYSITLPIYAGAVATRMWLRKHMSDRGATAVEYGLLVGLIAVVIAVTVLALGGGLNKLFGSTSSCVASAATTGGPTSASCP